jgi:hypothetical protein
MIFVGQWDCNMSPSSPTELQGLEAVVTQAEVLLVMTHTSKMSLRLPHGLSGTIVQ